MGPIETAPLLRVVQKLLRAPASRWFLLAAAAVLLLLVYTAILTTGAFQASTTQIEQWLLGRPLTRVDCLFYEWRELGDPLVIFFLTLLVGGVCLLLGYRWPVLPYLLLLLLICLIAEVVGKSLFTQPVPGAVSFGMGALDCPQIQNQPASVQLSAAAGMWWNLPPVPPQVLEQLRLLAQRPSSFGGDMLFASYPGGHAMRCSFLGSVIAWLCWRHIRRPLIRVPVLIVALVVAFGIGFIQFYIGLHLITDTIAGYLGGMAAACCAIGLLLLNAPKSGHAPWRGGRLRYMP